MSKKFINKLEKKIIVETADSAAKAITLLKQQKYDVIISDYQMPELNGLDFLNIVRNQLKLKIPFIFCTSRHDTDLFAKARELGATECIKKDGEKKSFVDLIDLIRKVTNQENSIENLKMYKKKYNYVVNTVNDCIVSINQKGTVTNWNKAAERLFQCTTEEIVGNQLTVLIPKRFRELFKIRFDLLLKTNKSFIFNRPVYFLGLRNDGEEFPGELSIASWKKDNVLYFTAIVRETKYLKKNSFEQSNQDFNLQAIISEVREEEK